MTLHSWTATAFARLSDTLRARTWTWSSSAWRRRAIVAAERRGSYRVPASPTPQSMTRFLDGGESWCGEARSSSGLVSRSSGGSGSASTQARPCSGSTRSPPSAFAIGRPRRRQRSNTIPSNALGPALLGLGLAVLWIVGPRERAARMGGLAELRVRRRLPRARDPGPGRRTPALRSHQPRIRKPPRGRAARESVEPRNRSLPITSGRRRRTDSERASAAPPVLPVAPDTGAAARQVVERELVRTSTMLF